MSPGRRVRRVGRRISAGMTLVLVLAGVALAAAADRPAPPPEAPPRLRPEAPEIALESLTGQRIALTTLRGRPAFLYFWATW